jgi:hypothetical protein
MPVCKECKKAGPSAEFRRSPTPGIWLCKDKWLCHERTKKEKPRVHGG